MNLLQKKIKEDNIKLIFTDYYDTIVHRSVHPNNVLRIWAKHMIRELGLDTTADELYFTFKDTVLYLVEKLKKDRNEIPYDAIISEVFTRLNNSSIIKDEKKSDFFTLFEKAHVKAEKSVQYINTETINFLENFKNNGGVIYLVSDFYCPKTLFLELLQHHKISHLFTDVFSSSSLGKSKHTGSIFKELITHLNIDPSKVLMMGDNKISDSVNAEKSGLKSFLLPHQKYHRQNKRNSFGHDGKNFKRIINSIYSECNASDSLPYTEYAIPYHFFVERLYHYCKRSDIKCLFFLSREGLYIKRLFDSFSKYHQINEENTIRTHYLKVSRQASLQISLKPLEKENFSYLRRKYNAMSVIELMNFFNLSEEVKTKVINTFEFSSEALIVDLFDSKEFKALKNNLVFQEAYESHRLSNKSIFTKYIQSFRENINTDGINVVDIGWGGTMQEAIYNFFDQNIKVTGFYLGVNTIYNPNSDTKRYGMNFSILPYKDYNFHILRANTQLYEQFAGAGHGCCVAYSEANGGYTIEHHEDNEKWLYDNHIGHHQEMMFKVHQSLMERLETICYTDEMVTDILEFVALKTGLIQSNRKVEFLKTLSSGYYQNISNKKTGIEYEIPKNLLSPKEFVKFLMTPEKYFRFIVKVKQKLHSSNKMASIFYPGYIIYGYYKLNKYIRFKVLKRFTLLRFNYLK